MIYVLYYLFNVLQWIYISLWNKCYKITNSKKAYYALIASSIKIIHNIHVESILHIMYKLAMTKVVGTLKHIIKFKKNYTSLYFLKKRNNEMSHKTFVTFTVYGTHWYSYIMYCIIRFVYGVTRTILNNIILY